MSQQKITVVIVGMGFGKEFIPIYQRHPNIKAVGICTRNRKTLDELAPNSTWTPNCVSKILMTFLVVKMSTPSILLRRCPNTPKWRWHR
jgi:hypothetical protein